jgi:transcriptional regulator with XRE-family HTH domain
MVMSTSPDLRPSIADHVRAARARAGYTLDQLAARAGVSKGYLSRLESGERQPSLATLLTLSRVLDVPMSILLGEGRGATPLAIHGPDQAAHAVNGLTITPYSGFAGSRGLEAVRITIDVDRAPPPLARHRGEEWVYVLSGVLRLEYGAESHLLSPGQSAHFDADQPHRLGAHRDATEMLLVAAETPHDLRRAHQYTDPASSSIPEN